MFYQFILFYSLHLLFINEDNNLKKCLKNGICEIMLHHINSELEKERNRLGKILNRTEMIST